MTHMPSTITQYAGIVIYNVLFSQPTLDLIFIVHFIVLLTHPPHAHHSFVICANSFIVTKLFPVTITNHTLQSIIIYICVISD